jgi:hypothetical protein
VKGNISETERQKQFTEKEIERQRVRDRKRDRERERERRGEQKCKERDKETTRDRESERDRERERERERDEGVPQPLWFNIGLAVVSETCFRHTSSACHAASLSACLSIWPSPLYCHVERMCLIWP